MIRGKSGVHIRLKLPYAISARPLRPFVQLGLLILAFWISLTRIRWATAKITICYYCILSSDYYHHPEDVITGAAVGIACALAAVTVSGIFNHETNFFRAITRIKSNNIKAPDRIKKESFKEFIREAEEGTTSVSPALSNDSSPKQKP